MYLVLATKFAYYSKYICLHDILKFAYYSKYFCKCSMLIEHPCAQVPFDYTGYDPELA